MPSSKPTQAASRATPPRRAASRKRASGATSAGALPRIGFVGLGTMGEPMSAHLARAGYALTLYDVRPGVARARAKTLGGAARAAATPREVGEASDIVITMVPNGEVVQRVVLGDDGLVHGMRAGSLLLDTSSSEPWLTRQTADALARQGVAMVDAPVSGARWGAEAAELVFMVGGAAADLERVRPLLDRMGQQVFHLGGIGCGHAMKCLNNLITAMTLNATAEGLVIGKRYGLDPAAMVQVLNVSTGGSWISRTHIEQRVLNRAFDDPFKLALMLKDVGIANALARDTASAVPLAALSQQLWQAASRAAGPDASVSELVRWVERQSDVEITPGAKPAALNGSA